MLCAIGELGLILGVGSLGATKLQTRLARPTRAIAGQTDTRLTLLFGPYRIYR